MKDRRRTSSGGRKHPLGATSQRGPVVPRADLPSCFTVADFNGLAIESQVLRDRGLSGSVIPTMVKARKSTSSKIYHCTWKAYISWCESIGVHPRSFSVARILAFLQQGVEQKLALSTIKGQVSALAVFFQRPLATHSLVRTFIQGVRHVAPPVRSLLPSWDLNLVLSVLQKPRIFRRFLYLCCPRRWHSLW